MKYYNLVMDFDFGTEVIEENGNFLCNEIQECHYDIYWLIHNLVELEVKSSTKDDEMLYVLLYTIYQLNPFYIFTTFRRLMNDKLYNQINSYTFFSDLVAEMTPVLYDMKVIRMGQISIP